MNLFDHYDEYIETLLLAQYEISEIIEHDLTRGEMREDFLKDQLTRLSAAVIVKGIISDGTHQSPQCDHIFIKNSGRRPLGSHSLIDVSDSLMVMDIKSVAGGEDFKKCDEDAKKIKSLSPNAFPLVGVFCYRISLKESTILKRFGYLYDIETDTYVYDQNLSLYYPNIDFILSLHKVKDEDGIIDERQFYLRKDVQPSKKYILELDKPIIKHIISLSKSLYI